MLIQNNAIKIRIFENLYSTDEEGEEHYEEKLLGNFAFLQIPRINESVVLSAFGSAYDGIPENIYIVEQVMHKACHLAWDSVAFQAKEEASGPSITIFVRFSSARQLTEFGTLMGTAKGKLRHSDELPQKYQYNEIK
jgi:hypothetical protein